LVADPWEEERIDRIRQIGEEVETGEIPVQTASRAMRLISSRLMPTS
jgi:hypothetical protein